MNRFCTILNPAPYSPSFPDKPMNIRIVHYPNTNRYGLLDKSLHSQICEGTLEGITQVLKRLEERGF